MQNSQKNTCAGDFCKKSYRPQTCNTIYWNNFLTHQRLFLLWYFHHKISKEKTVVLKNKSRHWSCSIKNLFLKTSQNLQKNTSIGVSFLINFIKKFSAQGNQVFALILILPPLISWIISTWSKQNCIIYAWIVTPRTTPRHYIF